MAKDRRLVVEHKDGRRISVVESDFDNPESNPYNLGGTRHKWDSDNNITDTEVIPPKPQDDWKSLKKEGFKPVMQIDSKTGNEAPLED